jgi:uncharacterized repeat protein (TIGR03803 family)
MRYPHISALGFSVLVLAFHAVTTDAGQLITLHQFNGLNGASPGQSLTVDGTTLYGTTQSGGANSAGTVFKINNNGSGFQTLLDLSIPIGVGPTGGLLREGSKLYGVAAGGTSSEGGSIYSVKTSGGADSTLVPFVINSPVGSHPYGDLLRVGNALVGTTQAGGISGRGTIFAREGAFLSVSLPSGTGGLSAPSSGVVQSGSTLYGTASTGGASGNGGIFKLDADGTGYQVLHSFAGGDSGRFPTSQPIVVGSTLYGTTSHEGTIYAMNTDGTNFNVLMSFHQTTSSDSPSRVSNLILVGDLLYGTTTRSGPNHWGTIFSIKLDGTDFQILHSFALGIDGVEPQGGLVYRDKVLYGTTSSSGQFGQGTVFALVVPEPSSFLMAGLGVVTLVGIAIRARARSTVVRRA